MIMAMLWNAIPGPWRIGLTIGLLVTFAGALGGAYLYVRHQGYQAGYSQASIECEADKQRQADANRKALSEAEKRLAAEADALSLKNMELDNAIETLSAAAAADPNGGLECLGLDSLQRLNSLNR